jgi:hypothetical protein
MQEQPHYSGKGPITWYTFQWVALGLKMNFYSAEAFEFAF